MVAYTRNVIFYLSKMSENLILFSLLLFKEEYEISINFNTPPPIFKLLKKRGP